MELYGIPVQIKNKPVCDPDFAPLGAFCRAYQEGARDPLAVCVRRGPNELYVYDTKVRSAQSPAAADCFYVERLVKFLLWARGGYQVTICGSEKIAKYIAEIYKPDGPRAFDAKTLSNIFRRPFEIRTLPYEQKPVAAFSAVALGGYTDGCRIGFDAGGSDYKIAAVRNGEVIFSEEIPWLPKVNSDPAYHFARIVGGMQKAASHLPRVDAIGVSAAGIYIQNETALASLFLAVPKDAFEQQVRDIFPRACKQIADAPFAVANDGDVTALAGAAAYGVGSLLGIAMGTSEAAGYADGDGKITGALNELAFAPVDARLHAAPDEWSGDVGCGVKYFSQDAVIRLAPKAGITLSEDLTPAQKLKEVQALAQNGVCAALDVFDSIGCYLAHTIPLYATFYEIRHILLLGRVVSGKGGEALVSRCRAVLAEEYPDLCVDILLPDEKSRRVGQCIAAAGLQKI